MECGCRIKLRVVEEEEAIRLKVYEGGSAEYSLYQGSYVIIPSMDEQVLDTKKKVLDDDLKVEGIPVSSVDNDAGGQTLTIGG